eukprot:COSAG01_NODE_697_length_14188_cov_41.810348_15_plen_88_part_00
MMAPHWSTGLCAGSTHIEKARASQAGHSNPTKGDRGTWRLPTLGADGKMKRVQLGYTLVCPTAMRYITHIRNHPLPTNFVTSSTCHS